MRKKWLSFILSLCMILSPVMQAAAVTLEEGIAPEAVQEELVSTATNSNAVKAEPEIEKRLEDVTEEEFCITEDFEQADTGAFTWGMTGGLSSCLEIREEDGNKYLTTTREKEVKETAAKKSFAVPRMDSASLSFQYRVKELKSGSSQGYGGFAVSCGDTDIITFYFNDLRAIGDTTTLYYSVGGFDQKVDSGIEVTCGEWYDVSLDFNFTDSTVNGAWGTEDISDVEIDRGIHKTDGFSFVTCSPSGAKSRMEAGLDDFCLSWEEYSGSMEDENRITALSPLKSVTISKQDWEEGYHHPKTVEALLGNGRKVKVEIDKDTWNSDPEFDADQAAVYSWTAKLATSSNANPDDLEAAYEMNYRGLSEHDYYNDFTMDSDIWEKNNLSSNIDSSSGSGSLSLSRRTEENSNSYLYAEANNAGHRGQRLILTQETLKGADISFDWMPVLTSDKGFGEVMVFYPDCWNSCFTVRFDKDFNLLAYTKCSLTKSSTVQPEFDGAISVDEAIETGLGGQNKWFSVQMHFDYINHTANLTITDQESGETFTQSDIPIDNCANGLSVLLFRKNNAYVGMGIDNVVIDYERFESDDIVAVQKMEDVYAAKSTIDSFIFPVAVKVEMGDGSTRTVKVGEWSSNPVFDREKEGEYIWTAQLMPEAGLNHDRNLTASFKMIYSLRPYPLAVQNPNALELEFGEALPELPAEVTVHLSDGTRDNMPVEEWVPIYEFDPQTEGVYVWGAKLKTNEKYQINENEIRPNEFHNVERKEEGVFPYEESPEKYTYHVYYRVNYFKRSDNYNGYIRSMENLERGVYAIQTDNGIFVSWRLLATEYNQDIQFYIYRNGVRVNDEPITAKTNCVDEDGKTGDIYTVETIIDGVKYESDPYKATEENYLNIDVQMPEPQPNVKGDLASYTLNDAGAADVDGDGKYEIIVKWYPSNGFDSGKNNVLSSPTIFDVYRMDGTPLWRLNMGLEMPSGAHFNQFMFYDLDEDGCAELFIKTSDGTTAYRPNEDGKFDMTDESTMVAYIGDPSVDPGSNLVSVSSGSGSNGHTGPGSNEYVTVFNGLTGEEIDTNAYANPTEDFQIWGDSFGNRSARYNIAVAYLPESEGSSETIPAVLLNRGYYKRTTVAAYTLRDGELNLEWNFVAPTETRYAGKGNHNVSTGDVDNDGFDELVIGSLALDHDGTVLWAKDGMNGYDLGGHADSIHLAAMTPDSDQLYVMTPAEDKNVANVNYGITNAANGGRIAGVWNVSADIGRGIAANITPNPGFEYWASVPNSEIPDQIPSGAIYNFYGEVISEVKPRNFSTNWRAYWDGDLLSELPDAVNPSQKAVSMAVHKYNWETNKMDTLEVFKGTLTNNSTKNTPCLTADLLGDWREEIMVRSADNRSLRIYLTDYETDYMIYTLMHDPVYRNAVANQNSAYNQPPHVGFYLGEDERDRVLNMELPVPQMEYTTQGQEGEPVLPDDPDMPYEPDTPDEPDIPDEPDTPDVPDKPIIPDYSYNRNDSADDSVSVYPVNSVVQNGRVIGYWVKNTAGWWCRSTDGTWPVSQWLYEEMNGRRTWYYFNSEGYMVTGWHLINGKWYYFNPVSDGTMGRLFVNTVTPDGYRVDQNGAWIP